MERTLTFVKPDGVKKNIVGEIISRYESAGLKVVALKMTRLTKAGAEGFYAVHKERPFFNDLTDFVSSGPIVPMIIEGEGAIKKVRDIMGATDPKDADEGTIRKDFADSLDSNIVHGSDGPDTSAFETAYFFGVLETCPGRE